MEIGRGCIGKRRTLINVLIKMSNKIVLIEGSLWLIESVQLNLISNQNSTRCPHASGL